MAKGRYLARYRRQILQAAERVAHDEFLGHGAIYSDKQGFVTHNASGS